MVDLKMLTPITTILSLLQILLHHSSTKIMFLSCHCSFVDQLFKKVAQNIQIKKKNCFPKPKFDCKIKTLCRLRFLKTFSMLFSKATTIEISQEILCRNFLGVRPIYFINAHDNTTVHIKK